MGRRPRILLPGGIYHVYNRTSHGAHVFRKDEEADRLEGLIAATKARDGFQILAWCVMSNHYHLAVRLGEVPFSRSMRTIHHRFAQSFNGRNRVFGPFWQGRFRSKWVGDDDYVRWLIAYIHLNPVTAGVVRDAVHYRWCGHREVVGRAAGRRLVDVNETLMSYHPKRREALAGYRKAMLSTLSEAWRSETPGRLPWWKVGRPKGGEDEGEIEVDETIPRIQMNGRSNVEMRPRIEIITFIELGAEGCGVTVADLRSSQRRSSVVEAREILAWLGTTLYGFKVKEIAEGFDKYGETASRLVSRAAQRRMDDVDFADRIESVDSAITKGATGVEGR